MTKRTPARARARRMPRQRLEGMTLVEIMIVVIIMATIATAVGVAVLPKIKQARIESTKTDAQTIRSAVTLWLGENSEGCPTVADLVEGRQLDRAKRTTDAWNKDFKIECEGEDFTVISGGPDGQFGTEDDIRQ